MSETPDVPAVAPEPATQDAELIVAVFRTVILVIALLLPRLLNLKVPTEGDTPGGLSPQIWLAIVTGIYNIATGIACLFPTRFGLRRPFIVIMDGVLITAWIRFSEQWDLLPFYYIVVVVAAMWFRVLGGVLAATFLNFFFFLFYWGDLSDMVRVSGPVLPIPLGINAALLFLVGALVGYIAEAQENERQFRLESQLLVANYQREIDLSTQLQPLLISQQWSGDGVAVADGTGALAQLSTLHDPNLEIGAAMKTARLLGGGDYFDVIPLEGRRTALCIADVSGKSVRAQARLPLLKYSLRALAPLYDAPEALMGRLSETLAPDLQPELFIAVCYVILDPQRGVLHWCNAGHIAPLLVSRQGTAMGNNPAPAEGATILELGANGPPLGMFPDLAYSAGSLAWCPGNELLLFTDGLTDALSYGASEDGEEQVRHLASRLLAASTAGPSHGDPGEPSRTAEAARSVRSIAQEFVDLATTVLDVNAPRPGVLGAALPRWLRAREKRPEGTRQHRDDVTVVLVRYKAG